jgi:hypothetical protein
MLQGLLRHDALKDSNQVGGLYRNQVIAIMSLRYLSNLLTPMLERAAQWDGGRTDFQVAVPRWEPEFRERLLLVGIVSQPDLGPGRYCASLSHGEWWKLNHGEWWKIGRWKWSHALLFVNPVKQHDGSKLLGGFVELKMKWSSKWKEPSLRRHSTQYNVWWMM